MTKFSSWRFSHWTRHSLILLGAGLIYIAIGIGFINAPPLIGKDPSLKIALHWISLDQWGYIFIACGICAIAASTWPIGKKVWGYMILTALSLAWCSFYVLAIIFYGAPKIVWISGLTWGLLAFIWWAVSGLISPEQLRRMNHGPD